MKLNSIKTQLIVFLACFAIFLAVKDRDITFLSATFISVIAACAIDSFFIYFREKKFRISDSSIISGLIIGYVLSSEEPWWKLFFASLLAISSKHLFRFNNKHLFNPAAFGIFLTLLFFGASTQWRGTYAWFILVPFGLYFISKVRKIEILIGYGLASLILFGVQAFIQKVPLSNIFGYLSYFYIFIMVIEPKTTPIKPLGKLIFGIGAAILIFILTESVVKFDAELCALLLLNLAVPLLNRLTF